MTKFSGEYRITYHYHPAFKDQKLRSSVYWAHHYIFTL